MFTNLTEEEIHFLIQWGMAIRAQDMAGFSKEELMLLKRLKKLRQQNDDLNEHRERFNRVVEKYNEIFPQALDSIISALKRMADEQRGKQRDRDGAS